VVEPVVIVVTVAGVAEIVTEKTGDLAVVVVTGGTGILHPSSRDDDNTSDDKQLKSSREQPGQEQHKAKAAETLRDGRNGGRRVEEGDRVEK
jgi:hypothetical protein